MRAFRVRRRFPSVAAKKPPRPLAESPKGVFCARSLIANRRQGFPSVNVSALARAPAPAGWRNCPRAREFVRPPFGRGGSLTLFARVPAPLGGLGRRRLFVMPSVGAAAPHFPSLPRCALFPLPLQAAGALGPCPFGVSALGGSRFAPPPLSSVRLYSLGTPVPQGLFSSAVKHRHRQTGGGLRSR